MAAKSFWTRTRSLDCLNVIALQSKTVQICFQGLFVLFCMSVDAVTDVKQIVVVLYGDDSAWYRVGGSLV